jgi:hypothetical protein
MRTTLLLTSSLFVCILSGCAKDGPPAEKASAPVPQSRFSVSPNFRQADLTKVAVLVEDRTRQHAEGGALTELEDEFTRALLEKGYRLASRSEVAAVLKEQQFQGSGLTDGEHDAARIGNMLNVRAVLLVSVTNLSVHDESRWDPLAGDLIKGRKKVLIAEGAVSAKLLNVQNAEVLCSGRNKGSREVEDRRQVTDLLQPVAAELAMAFPSPPTTH